MNPFWSIRTPNFWMVVYIKVTRVNLDSTLTWKWMNEWSIYIALYCVLLYTQSALQSYRGSLLNHHQCAASTWMMRRQPQDNGASALTTHQLQVERESDGANQVDGDYWEAMIDKGQWREFGQDTKRPIFLKLSTWMWDYLHFLCTLLPVQSFPALRRLVKVLHSILNEGKIAVKLCARVKKALSSTRNQSLECQRCVSSLR